MKKKKALPELNKVQKAWEGILKWGIMGIAFFHIVLLLGEKFHAASTNNALLNGEKWTLIGFFTIAILYCLYTLFIHPEQTSRLNVFLKEMFRPEMILLSLLFIWNIFCVMSADKQYQENFWNYNDSALFEVFVCFFVFFIFPYVLTKNGATKILVIFFHIIAIAMTALMIWVLWAVCKPTVISLPGGGQIGMDSNARLCINSNPNTVGAYAEVILMICLYLAITQKGLVRILYSLTVPIHYIILILSDSRTCIIMTAFVIGVVAFKLIFDATTSKKTWQRVVFGFLAFAGCFGLLLALQQPVREGYESISHFSALVGRNTTSVGRTSKYGKYTFNGRLELWVASVQSVLADARHFFFGNTPAGVVSEIKQLTNRSVYTHNQFCEILVANGVPGLLLYIAWLVLIAKKCFRNVVIRANGTNKSIVVIGGMILMLVLSNMFEATLLYYRFFTGCLFFTLCGLVAYEKEEKGRKSR